MVAAFRRPCARANITIETRSVYRTVVVVVVVVAIVVVKTIVFLDSAPRSDLEITHEIDPQFYVSEVKDMVNIVQRLIADGKSA